MWTLEYRQEASNYAIDSHPYNEAVLIAIEILAQTITGLPEEGCQPLEPELYWWQVHEHHVLFRRFPAEQRLVIVLIKPFA